MNLDYFFISVHDGGRGRGTLGEKNSNKSDFSKKIRVCYIVTLSTKVTSDCVCTTFSGGTWGQGKYKNLLKSPF